MSKIISGNGSALYERWAGPEMHADAKPQGGERDQRYLRADQIEKIQKQAYEEAYAQGLKEGIAAGQAQIKAQAQRMNQLAAKLGGLLGEQDQVVEQEICSFVLTIAKLVIRRELLLDSDCLAQLVREGLGLMPLSCRNIKVVLHPDDAELMRKHAVIAENTESSWSIIDDPSLSRGDCRIVSDSARIDATVDKRLDAVARRLFGAES